jgi:uncharacterized protein (TIGR03435 family)
VKGVPRRLLILALLPAAILSAQQPRFEVASIKPFEPAPGGPVVMSADGAFVTYTNIAMLDCIRGAYRVRDFQIAGPEWMSKVRFEIRAKLPAGASVDQIPEMLQSLLAERFKLEIRREMKEQKVYALMVGSDGARLKPAEAAAGNNAMKSLGPDGKPRAIMGYFTPPGGAVSITAQSATIESLIGLVSRFTARPIIDMTGIKGQYEFQLDFAGEIPGDEIPAESAHSVFDAFKRYGLRLEARKAPIEMLIVTHVEKEPTEN